MRLLIYAAIIICLCGCTSPDIAVIYAKGNKVIHPSFADMRQVVVSVAKDGSKFTTMTKNDSAFLLKTYDLSCKLLKQVTVPIFTEGYCGASSYALSEGGDKLVYYKDALKSLYVMDLSSKKEILLWKDIANTSLEIPYLCWISDSKIMIVLRDYPNSSRKTNEVTILYINSAEKRQIYTPVAPASFDYSLSPDTRWLAFQDANSPNDINGVIKILNLQTGVIDSTLGSGRQLIGRPCWSPDGTELAYFEGSEIKVWTQNSRQTRTLHKFSNGFVFYHIIFGSDFIGYIGSETSNSKNPLVFINHKSGDKLSSIKEAFNGRLFLMGNTDNLVSEIGY